MVLFLCSRNARPRKDGEGAARCPSCSQNAHTQKYARSMRAVKGNLGHSLNERVEEDWKALARVNGTSRRASGWAGEKAARS
jgi:predicted outer membrane protein